MRAKALAFDLAIVMAILVAVILLLLPAGGLAFAGHGTTRAGTAATAWSPGPAYPYGAASGGHHDRNYMRQHGLRFGLDYGYHYGPRYAGPNYGWNYGPNYGPGYFYYPAPAPFPFERHFFPYYRFGPPYYALPYGGLPYYGPYGNFYAPGYGMSFGFGLRVR